MKAINRPKKIESKKLRDVTGGVGDTIKPLQPAMPNGGATKYSADWWNFVRSRGGQ